MQHLAQMHVEILIPKPILIQTELDKIHNSAQMTFDGQTGISQTHRLPRGQSKAGI